MLQFARSLDPNAGLYMYLDDIYILADPAYIHTVMDFAVEAFGSIGLEVKPSKTQAWCALRDRLPQSLQTYFVEEFKVLKKALTVPGDLEHQGAGIQGASGTLDKEMQRLDALTSRLLVLVQNGLDLQTAFSLLRSYAGPASQYALRTSSVTELSARAYDVHLAVCWSRLLGRDVSADEPRLFLPLRMGGCGAVSAVHRMFAAPFASWTAVSVDVARHMGATDFAHVLARAPTIEQQLSTLQVNLISQGTLASIEFLSIDRAIALGRSQSQLVGHIHKLSFRALRSAMDADSLAILKSAGGKGAGAFMETPLDDRFVMTNQRFTIACVRRLGHEWCAYVDKPQVPPLCTNTTANGRVCGHPLDPLGKHQECCAPGGGLLVRHDNMVRCIATLATRTIDPRPKTEQILPELARLVAGQTEAARMDVIVHDGIVRSLVDATIVSPLAGGDSFRNACARRDGHAARRAECIKRVRYPAPDLVPFALETGGRLGTAARSFLMRMAGAAADPAAERVFMYRAVSSTLQDGVARQLELRK